MPKAQQGKLGLRIPTEEDLDEIAKSFESLDSYGLGNSFTRLELTRRAVDLQLDLTDDHMTQIILKAKELLKEKEKNDQARLDEEFEQAVKSLFPKCPDCGKEEPLIRSERHTHETNGLRSTSVNIKFLYCECGRMFFNSGVEDLNERFRNGEFKAKPRIKTSRLH